MFSDSEMQVPQGPRANDGAFSSFIKTADFSPVWSGPSGDLGRVIDDGFLRASHLSQSPGVSAEFSAVTAL